MEIRFVLMGNLPNVGYITAPSTTKTSLSQLFSGLASPLETNQFCYIL